MRKTMNDKSGAELERRRRRMAAAAAAAWETRAAHVSALSRLASAGMR